MLPLVLALQVPRLVAPGDTVSGRLALSSPRAPDGRRAERYVVQCRPGLILRLEVVSAWDNLVAVLTPDNRELSRDDDGGGGTNARLDWTCPDARAYTIVVAAYGDGVTGPFTLRISDVAVAPAFPPNVRTLAPDDFAQGTIGPGAAQYRGRPVVFYGFQCRPGLIVSINLGADFDDVLYVVGPSGLAGINDDANGTDAALTFTCPDAALYRIGAGARQVDATGTFRLYLRKMS